MTIRLIAADIGGTKTLLTAVASDGRHGPARRYENHCWPDFESVLADFLAGLSPEGGQRVSPLVLSLSVAGPVTDGQCHMTNLDWHLDAVSLAAISGIPTVVMQNDLAATARALPSLARSGALQPLNGLDADLSQPVAVLSLGTGLGEALLLPEGGSHRVVSSEGGHKAFAPFDVRSAAMLHAALSRGQQISREHWISGSGLPALHAGLHPGATTRTPESLVEAALAAPSGIESDTLEFLANALLAEAGDVALQYWSSGGVVIAGGLAQAIAPWLRRPEVLDRFSGKTQYRDWLSSRAITLCTSTEAALQGAIASGLSNLRTQSSP
jgi:glucokinase